MSFSTLVSDIAFRDAHRDDRSSQVSHARSQATARSYPSTAATSVSISGDISSQLHAGYSHPLTRSWQAERQLTKARNRSTYIQAQRLITSPGNAHLSPVHYRQS
jgi:porphobilinogen synthase